MDLKNLFSDEDAVSPVIGVILMVAITVILAAVIGTFVLGLGDQVQSSAPNANFQFSYDEDINSNGDDAVSIVHNGGQDIDPASVSVNIGGTEAWNSNGEQNDFDENGSDWGTAPISTGDQLTLNDDETTSDMTSGQTVRVIWESPSGGSSNTIGSSTVAF